MKIVLLAEEAAGLRALRALLASGDELVGLVTSSSSRDNRPSSIEKLAQSAECKVWRPSETRGGEFAEEIQRLQIDLILNVHSLHILDGSIVCAPRIGSFNLHPGPLPQFAGLNAPSWAVFMGEKQHAVTLHWMAPGVDTGPIAYAASFELNEQDTGLSVSNTCVKLGVPLIEKLCATARSDVSSIPSIAQDARLRRFFSRDNVPNNGRIDWSASAQEISAFVRAADYGPLESPWGHPLTRARELDVGIVRVRVTEDTISAAPGCVLYAIGDNVGVASGDRLVELERIQVQGKSRRPAEVMREGDILE